MAPVVCLQIQKCLMFDVRQRWKKKLRPQTDVPGEK